MSKTLKYTWDLYFVLTSYGPNAIFYIPTNDIYYNMT